MVEARIGISMTTVLTLTAMFSSVRYKSKASYRVEERGSANPSTEDSTTSSSLENDNGGYEDAVLSWQWNSNSTSIHAANSTSPMTTTTTYPYPGAGSWVDVVLDSVGFAYQQRSSSSVDLSTSLLEILLPPRYSKHILPTGGNGGIALDVGVRLLLHEVVDVDIKDERVKLDVDFDISWIDYNVREKILSQESLTKALEAAGIYYIPLDADFLKYVWKPDISFEELSVEDRPHFLTEKISLLLHMGTHDHNHPNAVRKEGNTVGCFQLHTRRTLNLKCDMDFKYYPADTQKCTFNLGSYQYQSESLNLLWKTGILAPVYLQTAGDPNFDFQVAEVEPGNELRSYQLSHNSGGNWSALTFSLQIRRNVTYHLVQTYLPSVLLVLITWLCFLLPPDMVEGRVGIAMTTVLTLTAMFSSIREKSPEVSYTMAIDIWMVFCIFLVFLSLVLFTLVYWLRRKSLQLIRDANLEVSLKESGTETTPSHRTKSFKLQIEQEGLADIDSKRVDYFQLTGALITKYAFALFAFIFLTFLVTYTVWLAVSSEYLKWKPSSLYNAGEEGGEYKYIWEKI